MNRAQKIAITLALIAVVIELIVLYIISRLFYD